MRTTIYVCAAVSLAAALFSVMVALDTARCGWRWAESGYGYRHTMGVGCMVKVDGRWVPEASVRM